MLENPDNGPVQGIGRKGESNGGEMRTAILATIGRVLIFQGFVGIEAVTGLSDCRRP